MDKILIWGTGYISNRVIDNEINGEIIGFIETRKRIELCRGLPVYEWPLIPKDYDYIIVAVESENTIEIKNTLKDSGIDADKLVYLYGKEIIERRQDKLITLLGEKNYTIFAGNHGFTEGTFVEKDAEKYRRLNKRKEFEIKDEWNWFCINDKYSTNSGFDAYFWQDLWGAKHIINAGVKEHYDIASRVDGFISHLLVSGIKVHMIDIRPFNGKVDGLDTIVDDATQLRQFSDNSIGSLSALCSLEHFGLGRYGDEIDPEACFRCFDTIQKKLKTDGIFIMSVPIGFDHVEFNAHRVFRAQRIIECFNQCELIEYSVINGNLGGVEYNCPIIKYDNYRRSSRDDLKTGLFYFKKK